MIQLGIAELEETPSPKCLLMPGYTSLSNEIKVIVTKPSEDSILPVSSGEIGSVFVKSDYLNLNELVGLCSATAHVYQ